MPSLWWALGKKTTGRGADPHALRMASLMSRLLEKVIADNGLRVELDELMSAADMEPDPTVHAASFGLAGTPGELNSAVRASGAETIKFEKFVVTEFGEGRNTSLPRVHAQPHLSWAFF